MKNIEMLVCSSGPEACHKVGARRTLPNKVADRLIAAGQARELIESADVVAPENAAIKRKPKRVSE